MLFRSLFSLCSLSSSEAGTQILDPRFGRKEVAMNSYERAKFYFALINQALKMLDLIRNRRDRGENE